MKITVREVRCEALGPLRAINYNVAVMSRRLLALLSIAVLCVILDLGLWPFHAPKNAVSWVTGRNGLRFGGNGTAIGAGVFKADDAAGLLGCSVEIWLEAAGRWNSGTILAFYDPHDPLRLSLHQSLTDLVLERLTAGHRHRKGQKLYADNLFRPRGPVFVTVTSGAQGTAIYVNGARAKAGPAFHLSPDSCSGRLVLGDGPLEPDAWRGKVYGLAIYQTVLPPFAVQRHYAAWIKTGEPGAAPNERNAALFLFREGAGKLIHNDARPGIDLSLPANYTVLDKIFLQPFWDEFELSRSYGESIVKNIIGFVPLGFCFYAYFLWVRRFRHPRLATVLVGTAVSLTIELLQYYLPTRQSGTTDLITNTLGTYLGVVSYTVLSRVWVRMSAGNPGAVLTK